jgi:hypothetical protein
MAERKRRTRTTPRVTDTEPKGAAQKAATHRGNTEIPPLAPGMIEIIGQASELVPVAQYANVTIGPVAARRLIADPGLSKLVGTEPDDWDDEQEAIADQFKGEYKVMQDLLQEVIAEDREAVEESVRLHNQREAEEAKSRKAKN